MVQTEQFDMSALREKADFSRKGAKFSQRRKRVSQNIFATLILLFAAWRENNSI